jgi:hypothetical protein
VLSFLPSIIDKIKEEEERRQEVDKKNLECKNTVKNLGFNALIGMLFQDNCKVYSTTYTINAIMFH